MDIESLIILKLEIKLALVSFLFSGLLACDIHSQDIDIKIHYEKDRAAEISFVCNLESYSVFLKESTDIPVLGIKNKVGDRCVFKPIVPFSNGGTYIIRSDNSLIGTFNIIRPAIGEIPEILNIYPTADTVPQNLLKIYVQFSEPMQAIGNSSEFIKVNNLTAEKQTSIFLELENELWNHNRTLLTLWLDPGRIKQDLIPNRKLGMPLNKNNKYEIIISDNWRSIKGEKLVRSYSKQIIVGAEDKTMPDVSNWKITLPHVNSKENLLVEFHDVMDAIMVLESISIYNQENDLLLGEFKLNKLQNSIFFKPMRAWEAGRYTLSVKSKLEDLAGNNLNRMFDTDLSKIRVNTDSSELKVLNFKID